MCFGVIDLSNFKVFLRIGVGSPTGFAYHLKKHMNRIDEAKHRPRCDIIVSDWNWQLLSSMQCFMDYELKIFAGKTCIEMGG